MAKAHHGRNHHFVRRDTAGPIMAVMTKGLASESNQRYVLGVLESSSAEEVESLLERVGLGRRLAAGIHRMSVDEMIKARLEEYISSPVGQQKWKAAIAFHVRRMLLEWARSSPGRAAIDLVKAEVLREQLDTDQDLVTTACREALKTKVERWLASPLGLAQLEQEKQKALRLHAAGANSKAPTSWIDRQLSAESKHV